MSDEGFKKRLIYTPLDDDGRQVIFPVFHKVAYLDKLASRADLMPKVASFISNIKPSPEHRHVLICSMGAGDFWGMNKNADYFRESQLAPENEKWGHKTFLKSGVYKHHVSAKKGGKSAGKVVLAEYNPEMHRVELVLRYDTDKDPDMIQRIDQGQMPPYSMGCTVPYDICMVLGCGKKSKEASDYCWHMAEHAGEILPDGQKVGVDNPEPNFHDISRVIIGACKTAKLFGKIASLNVPTEDTYPTWFSMPSGLVAIKCGDLKDASIEKKIYAMGEPLEEERELKDFEKTKELLNSYHEKHVIAPDDLSKLAKFAMDASLSSFASLGIQLNPSEFQYLVLNKMNKSELAESLNKIGCVFTKEALSEEGKKYKSYMGIDIAFVDPEIIKIASNYLKTRSVLFPFVLEKALMIRQDKRAALSTRPPIPINDLKMVSDLYSIYLEKLAKFGPTGLKRASKHVPAIRMALFEADPTPFSLDRTFSNPEKVAAEDDTRATVKDYVTGCLLSPQYRTSFEVIKNTDHSHFKIATILSDLTPTKVHRLHPDTSAWATVLITNSSFKDTRKETLNGR